MKRLLGWLGLNGHATWNERANEPPLCIVRHFPRMSPHAERYRSLRTALELVGQSTPFQTLLVASPGTGEGKSTTLINLAVLFWELGHRVLAVDSDLRRGCMHQVFGVARAPGLTDMVLGTSDTLLPMHKLKPGFCVMPCGSHYDKPAVLLGSQSFRQAMALFQAQADIILMDSSPLLPVSDALKLVSAVDAVLLVVQAGRTLRRDVAKARKLLQASRANVIGVVLNGVQDRTFLRRPPDKFLLGVNQDQGAEALPDESGTVVDALDRFA